MKRRSFIALGSTCLAQVVLAQRALPKLTAMNISLPGISESKWKETIDSAWNILAKNIRTLPEYDRPVLIEGSTYIGTWQECGPHESLVYAQLRDSIPSRYHVSDPLQISRNTHMAFFVNQRPDGQLPASVKSTEMGYGQIQMVVPIAATSWELAQILHDEEFLAKAYEACTQWNAWLRKYRDTRKTGLVEGFCNYDSGHDNSPRWKGIPNRCPDADARKYPQIASMPRLCPDLSATVYGGRIALAAMAEALGKQQDAEHWRHDAETIRELIIAKLYCEEDAAFYDLDNQNNFVRVRSDVISRVLGEHVLHLNNARDRKIFDALWKRELHNPHAFWAKYPLTSIAQDDPTFVRPIPRNSWGGASQALTALRTLRWMPFYGQQEAFNELMQQWCEALIRDGGFRQQLDPQTGVFTLPDPGNYSPAALVFLEFSRQLGRVK